MYDAPLVGAGGEGLEVDDLPDVGLQERAGDLVEALPEHLLVDHRGVAHLRERAGDAPAQLREHHLGWAPGGSGLVGGGVGFRRRSGAVHGVIWERGWGRGRGREENRSRKEVVAGRAAAGRGGGGGSEEMREGVDLAAAMAMAVPCG